MATTNIDEAFANIERDFVELSKNAAKNAAMKAQEDIRKKAVQFIDEYYEYKPKWYGKSRKKALYNLIKEYYRETPKQKGIQITFGIKYVPSKIKNAHKSYSPYHKSGNEWVSRADDPTNFHFDKGDNGIPEATWITDKFLDGIHPSGKLGDDGGVRDKESPDEKMQHFFDKELEDLVNTYMNEHLLDSVEKYF